MILCGRSSWRGALCGALLAVAVVPAAGLAQVPGIGQLNPLGANQKGLHLYGAYGYASYLTSPGLLTTLGNTGFGTAGLGAPGSFNRSYDTSLGGGGSLGWSSSSVDPLFSIVYTGVYRGFVRHPEFNGLNQYVRFNLGAGRHRQLTRRWSVGFSGSARAITIQEFLFSSTGLGTISGVPATYDELASGIISGRFTNQQLAASLTGASVAESPAQVLLFGNDTLYADLGVTVAYAYSPRLVVTTDLNASRYQQLPNLPGDVRGTALLQQSTFGRGGVGLTYSISPRTSFGVRASSTRTFSRYVDSYLNNLTFSLGRILSRRWFTELHGGGGYIVTLKNTFHSPHGLQYTAGGGIGYKTYSHTIMASTNRLVQDEYGLGASSSLYTNLAWTWARPGRRWAVFSSAGEYRINGSVFGTVNSWRVYAGINRELPGGTGVSLLYSYLTNKGNLIANPNARTMSGAMLVFYWTPGRERARAQRNNAGGGAQP